MLVCAGGSIATRWSESSSFSVGTVRTGGEGSDVDTLGVVCGLSVCISKDGGSAGRSFGSGSDEGDRASDLESGVGSEGEDQVRGG